MKLAQHLFLGLCLVLLSCKEEIPTSPPVDDRPLIEQTFPIRYEALPPSGKLPYPHHNPTISQAELRRLTNELFIINNYAQYQCGDDVSSCYFHDALDIILPNGTPIFAVDSGIVRANIGGNEFYRSLAIEDMKRPGQAWFYTHVYDFVVEPGDRVEQGQFLGVVNFQGLEHIHLGRGYLSEGGNWDQFMDWVSVFPDEYFVLIDEDPPVIETPFYFFKNRSDERFEHGQVDTVSGEVDIVVGMRDAGQYAGGWLDGGAYWGDRLCVKRVEFRILKENQEILKQNSFDFSQLHIRYGQGQATGVGTVYKHHLVMNPDHSTQNWNRFVSHYILTNANPDSSTTIAADDTRRAWMTAEQTENGMSAFPDGLYIIEVTAFDTHNNMRVQRDSVYVKNE